jgi:Holliday junction resolvasome RuvABC endonuclease subunit
MSTSKKKITEAGYIDIHKESTIKDKAHKVVNSIENLIDTPSTIVVEDSLSGFGGGRTSQQTIVKLAKCNAVISYVVEALFQVEIDHVNVSTLRKAVFGKSRMKGVDSKQFVREQLENMLDLSKFIVYNSRKNYDKKNYDMLDATVASLYHWYK